MGILIDTLAFVIIAKLLPGFKMQKPATPFIAAVLYCILGYIMGIFAMPFFIAALVGFAAILGPLSFLPILLVIFAFNVAVLVVTDKVLEDFEMVDMQTAIIASALLTGINYAVRAALS